MIKRPFDYNNPDEEYQKMFEIIGIITKNQYKPDIVSFNFNTDNGTDNWTVYRISYEDLQKIKSKDDIEKFKQ